MDQLQAMRIFVRVVECGSFSQAGRDIGLASSSVSRIVGDLEAELGSRLFNRTTRSLSLTEAGGIYLDRTRGILFDLEEARLEMSGLSENPSGVLRLTVPTGVGRELLISALPVFLEKYPAVKIILSMTDRLMDVVETGFDVAIRVGRQRDSSLIARKIGSCQRLICGSPRYLRNHSEPKSPGDLGHHNCLTWREHPGHNNWTFRVKGGRQVVAVSGNFFSKNADALVAAAVSGLGLVLLPDWNMSSEIQQKRLRPVLRDFELIPDTSPIYAVYPSQRHLSPKVRAFIDFMADRFATGRG